MLVISIQSQVAFGYVGNSAAGPVIQAHGVDLAAVPTTLLSNHPRYPTVRGRILEPALVADLLRGVEERGLVERATVLLTGYLGSVAIAEIVADFVARARAANPGLTYICDPVIGDDDSGVFVAPGLPELFRTRLVPQATIATPNQFELELLAGTPARTAAALVAAAERLRASGTGRVVATGCTLADTEAGAIETIATGGAALQRVATPRLPIRPSGTGDLIAGLLAAHIARGVAFPDALAAATAGTFRVLENTQADHGYELSLARSIAELLAMAPAGTRRPRAGGD